MNNSESNVIDINDFPAYLLKCEVKNGCKIVPSNTAIIIDEDIKHSANTLVLSDVVFEEKCFIGNGISIIGDNIIFGSNCTISDFTSFTSYGKGIHFNNDCIVGSPTTLLASNVFVYEPVAGNFSITGDQVSNKFGSISFKHGVKFCSAGTINITGDIKVYK
jgi:acetyltransferase-like isoleucine patch superfamily enzyme